MNEYKASLRRDFSKAAGVYNQYADLQKLVAHKLVLDHQDIINKANTILDIGCGTGYIGSKIKELYPQKNIIQTDIATQMAIYANKANLLPTVISDMENLPFADNSVDMVISSLAVQWGILADILASIKRILKPSGYILLASITNNSFSEIKEICPDMEFEKSLSQIQMQEICNQANIENLNVITYPINQTFSSIKDFFLMLKNIGAKKKNNKQTIHIGKKFFSEMEQKYISSFPNKTPYSISWEIALIKNINIR